jgi:hypothetical protein
LIASKSKNFFPDWWRNSPHSLFSTSSKIHNNWYCYRNNSTSTIFDILSKIFNILWNQKECVRGIVHVYQLDRNVSTTEGWVVDEWQCQYHEEENLYPPNSQELNSFHYFVCCTSNKISFSHSEIFLFNFVNSRLLSNQIFQQNYKKN